MSNKIYLFTGEEQYLLHQELQRRKERFVLKHGREGLFVYNDVWDPGEVVSCLQGGGLFSSSKLVVIYGIPQDTLSGNKFNMTTIDAVVDVFKAGTVEKIDGLVVVCVSYKPDKRLIAYKRFKKEATIKEFESLKEGALIKYVEEIAGDIMNHRVIEYFVGLTGNNLYHIHHELEKIRGYCALEQCVVTGSLLDMIVYPRGEVNNFAFLDAMFVDRDKALDLLENIQASGVVWQMFVGAVYWGLKIMLQMIVLYQDGMTGSSLLAKEIGCPPFSIGSYVRFVDVLIRHRVRVEHFFDQLLALDVAIRKGKMPDTSCWVYLKKMLYDFHEELL